MKIENSWVNLTLVKMENDKTLKEYNIGKVFRIEDDVDYFHRINIIDVDEYYICLEINKEDEEYEIKYISLNDYFHFLKNHSEIRGIIKNMMNDGKEEGTKI